LLLLFQGQRKEASRYGIRARNEVLGQPMVADIEEADGLRRIQQLARHVSRAVYRPVVQWRHVDDRNGALRNGFRVGVTHFRASQCVRIWLRNSLVRSDRGAAEELRRRRSLDDAARVHEHHGVGDLAGKTHLVRYADHRHSGLGQVDHHVEHFLDHFRIEGRRRLVEQHDLRLHAERPRDRHALLLSTGQLRRVFPRLLGNAHARKVLHGFRFGFHARRATGANLRQCAVLQRGKMRKQVELLEHHADFAPDGRHVLRVLVECDAIDDNGALVVLLEAVDAANQRRLSRSRWPAHDHSLALATDRSMSFST
jgi:hypothetical protein